MSLLSDKVFVVLSEAFPYYRIEPEFFVSFENQRLFFDFYVPELLLVVEVQGVQHDEFVPHFHKNRLGFLNSRRRDMLKCLWASNTGHTLIEIREKDLPMSTSELMCLIYGEANA